MQKKRVASFLRPLLSYTSVKTHTHTCTRCHCDLCCQPTAEKLNPFQNHGLRCLGLYWRVNERNMLYITYNKNTHTTNKRTNKRTESQLRGQNIYQKPSGSSEASGTTATSGSNIPKGCKCKDAFCLFELRSAVTK